MVYKHIPVKPRTYEKLQNLGRKGETFDQIVNKLLRQYYLEEDQQ
jgi:hypothetical protein